MALFGLGCVVAVIESDHKRPEAGWDWHTYMDTLIGMLGGYSIAAAAAAMVATEVLEVIVMLAEALKDFIDAKREKRHEQIRQEARQQERVRMLQSGMPFFGCPIWGTPATLFPTARPAAVFGINSERAGGKYEMSIQLLAEILTGSLTIRDQDRETVTQWLNDQRAAGVDIPVLTVEVVHNLVRPDQDLVENDHPGPV